MRRLGTCFTDYIRRVLEAPTWRPSLYSRLCPEGWNLQTVLRLQVNVGQNARGYILVM